MLIRFTRLSNDRHRFEIIRDDGTHESQELETRSSLLHDLTHYAVEVEAGLEESFYGRLAQGIAYDELTATPPKTLEAMQTECVVVQVQNPSKHDATVAAALKADTEAEAEAQKILASFAATESEPPRWVTGEFIARVRERLRRVQGRWRATPFHQTMELEFPARE